jgi:hypothetical protein
MKEHHLDKYIKDIQDFPSGNDIDIGNILIIILKELRSLDQRIDLIHEELDQDNGYD